jgi:outer membrane protein TolC
LRQGWTTRANFEQAQQAFRTAQAAVDDAKAQVEIAEDRIARDRIDDLPGLHTTSPDSAARRVIVPVTPALSSV